MKKPFKYLLFSFVFLLFSAQTLRAKNEPDSIIHLKKQLENVAGKDRMKKLRSLAIFYQDSYSEMAMGYVAEYLKLAQLCNSKSEQAQAYLILSSIHKFQAKYSESQQYNFKVLQLYEEMDDSLGMAKMWFRISDNYNFAHQFDSSVYYNKLGYQYFKNRNDSTSIFSSKMLLCKAFCGNDMNEQAKEIFQETTRTSYNLNNLSLLAWSQYWLGFVNMKLGNFSQAEDILKMSMENYQKSNDDFGKIGSQQELGDLYLKTGKFADSYQLFVEAHEKHECARGEMVGANYKSQYFINIGNLYLHIEKYDKALAFFDSANQIAGNYNFEDKAASVKSLQGKVWFKKGELTKALEYYQTSLDYYLTTRSKYYIANLQNEIGDIYQQKQDYHQALTCYEKSLKLNNETGNKFGIALNHINMADCHQKTGNLSKLKKELDSGIEYAIHLGIDQLLLRYYTAYINYSETTGNHTIAHQYFDQYLPLSEKYIHEAKCNLTSLLVDLYENEIKTENQIHAQHLKFSNLEAERDQLRIHQLIFLASSILLALILIVYFLVNRIRMTKKLEMQVNERTKALLENEKKLIDINETRNKFYSIIAHDLKSPFNALIGFSNLLCDDYDDFSDQEHRQFITIIRNSSEEIFALLENLLDWTRKSSENITVKPIKIDFRQIVRQSIQLQEKNAQSKEITIHNLIPKNTFVLADENMLRTIIRNFTSNALKFTEQKGQVVFEVIQKDGFMECSVTDNGIGMSQKVMDNIFSMKAKVKKKGTANESGTGLGLLLCKDFIARNGGELLVESKEGEGSKFIFTLPAG